MRAALCFSDGFFRVWNGGEDAKSLSTVKDFPLTATVVRLPDSNKLLTASYGDGQARFRQWQIGTNARPSVKPLPTPLSAESFVYPRTLGLLSRKADGKADLAATVLSMDERRSEYRLQIVDITAKNFGDVQAEEILWPGPSSEPVLATSPRGRFVAVAGSGDHVIRVYSLNSLLSKKKTAPQELRSLGVTFQRVSFVRKGPDLGLLLNRTARKTPGEAVPDPDTDREDLVFAIRERRLTSNLAGWKTAAPPASAWRAEYEKTRRGVKVWKGDRLVRIKLPDRHELSDYALLPPSGDRKVPLLALATHEKDQPQLVVYDAETGQEMRHFVGHADRLTSLAFSDDGRFLASTARDQTLCVWSLTTFDQKEGKFGLLPGVSVRQRDGALVVAQNKGELRAGETIFGLVEAGKLRPLVPATVQKFNEEIFYKKAGSTITLRVGDGDDTRDVKLVVEQGPDERKFLFSLFILSGYEADEPDWIGWHPLGPYDASSARAERHLGWHFNTGEGASRPVSLPPRRIARIITKRISWTN